MEEEIKIFIKLDLRILNFPSKVQEPGELYGSPCCRFVKHIGQ